jgi:uncharacterized membrane protein (UPF0127 family)
MGVRSLGEGDGMAFLFPSPTTTPFWMKDTLIPLDIAFWNSQGHIVTIQTMVPCRAEPCYLYQPTSDYASAVEMNAGLLRRHGVAVGDAVDLRR